MLDINSASSGTQPTLVLPHARHRTPNASAFSCGRASGCQTQTLQPTPPKRSPAHYLWAVLIARIYEVFPLLCPARGPPLWDDCSDARTDEGVHIEPDWDLAAQLAPDFEVDQRICW